MIEYSFDALCRDAQAQKRANEMMCAQSHIRWHISRGWRKCRSGLRHLLDPYYVHPKRKRHA